MSDNLEAEQLELHEITKFEEDPSAANEAIILGSSWEDIKHKCDLLLKKLKINFSLQ